MNIISFCELKDDAIQQKYNVTEEAKEMYESFLRENLAKEKRLREKKYKFFCIYIWVAWFCYSLAWIAYIKRPPKYVWVQFYFLRYLSA